MLQVPVTFDDVAVCFSEEEWKGLQQSQKDLYREVMNDNYQNLTSLGFAVTKPEIVVKIERGEDPFVSSRWDFTALHRKTSRCRKPKKIVIVEASEIGNPKQPVPSQNKPGTLHDNHNPGQKHFQIKQSETTNKQHSAKSKTIKSFTMTLRKPARKVCKSKASSAHKVIVPFIDSFGRTYMECNGEIESGSTIEHTGVNDSAACKDIEQQNQQVVQPENKQRDKNHNVCKESTGQKDNGVTQENPTHTICSRGLEEIYKCIKEEVDQETPQFPELQESYTGLFINAQSEEKRNQSMDFLSQQMGTCPDRPYSCNVCSKTFVKKQHLTAHRRTHTGERPFTCGQCGRSFRQNSTLTTHLWSHAGHKPFHCNCCPKSFSRKTDLIAHIRRHTGERPYECTFCWERFIRKKSLKRHLEKHTAGKLAPRWVNNHPKVEPSSSVGIMIPKYEECPTEGPPTLALSELTAQLCFKWNADEQQVEADRATVLPMSHGTASCVSTERVKVEEQVEEKHIRQEVNRKHQTTQTAKKRMVQGYQVVLKELRRVRRNSARVQQEWRTMKSKLDQLSEEMKELKEMVGTLCAAKTLTNAGRSTAEPSTPVLSTPCPVWSNCERISGLQSEDRLSIPSGRASPESSLQDAYDFPVGTLTEEHREQGSWIYVTSSNEEDDLMPSATAVYPVKTEDESEPISPPYSALYRVGERLPNITMLPLSAEREWSLLSRCGGKPGRFAALIFRAIVPFDIYKGWVNHVNLDGLRGRKGIPLNVKNQMMGIVERHFNLRKSEHCEIRNRINEQLRTRRKSDKHPNSLY
ncbi:zinc finger protein 37A [Bombina bombina]|uniref:zinc finger protein 37A n=1 Tax=Bombina bombina TaxID=8345 RepID=UPI00235A700B|nr:zinc finger protein 37A [Bombina bombina]